MSLAITSEETALIQQFRSRIADILPSDAWSNREDTLIRWIRAREGDLGKAEEMFRNSLKWRTENKIESLLLKLPDQDLREKFPYNLDGIDKTGRPIVTIPYGDWDVRTFIESEGPERFVQYTNQLLESALACVKKGSKNTQSCLQFVMISDMANYTYRQLANMKAVQSVIQMVSVYEAHYPETMGQCIVINAPSVFSILFGMMKPLMSGRTIEKIKIFSDDRSKWEPVIHEIIEPEQIQERFGGIGTKL